MKRQRRSTVFASLALIVPVLLAVAGCGGSSSVSGAAAIPQTPPPYTDSAREFILADGSHLYLTLNPTGSGSAVMGEVQLFPPAGSTKDMEIFDVTGTIEGSRLHLILNGNRAGGAVTYILDGNLSQTGDEKLQLTDGTGKDSLAEPPQTIDSSGVIPPAARNGMEPATSPPMTGTGPTAVTIWFFAGGQKKQSPYTAAAGSFWKSLAGGRLEQGGLVGHHPADESDGLWMLKWPNEGQWAWYEQWLNRTTQARKFGSGVIKVDPNGYFWISKAQDVAAEYFGVWYPANVVVNGPSPYLSLHNGPN